MAPMRRQYALPIAALAAVTGASMPAHADETTAPVRPFIMSDLSGRTLVGLDFQLTRWTVPASPPLDEEIDVTSMTTDLVADISVAPHWVILLRVPTSYASTDPELVIGDDECCGAALGNLTLGVRGLRSSYYDGGLRSVIGGEMTVALPTAPDSGDGAVSTNLAAFARAPHDPGRYLPNTGTIRLGGGAQLYGRRFLVQAGLGLDAFIYDDDVPENDADFAVRLGLGGGVRFTYTLALIAELNAMALADSDNLPAGDEDLLSSLDVGLRYGGEALALGIRAYVPLDGDHRDLDAIGLGLDAGARF
jgi:hypothetical protein